MKTCLFALMMLITTYGHAQEPIGRQARGELITDEMDLSLNKISLVHSIFPFCNGSHIYASIKEQRFDSTDIDLKGRFFKSGIESETQSTHATIIATMLGGGGNSSSFSFGSAPGVHLCSTDFTRLFPESKAFYQQQHISVQNHSYGTGIENYYGEDAAAYDQSVVENPSLVHVFSAGNSGDGAPSTGKYAGIHGFANITGSFKMAKNIITVGSVDSFNVVSDRSSRGPAFDGRVKPELVAFGNEGSSGAAALVSGTAALLQDAFVQDFNSFPSAALVRAILLNTADHINGSPVSYLSGFGSLNAYHAMRTVKAKQFIEDTIQQGTKRTIEIPVPANILSLKVMLTWTDPPATANAGIALVNDLDSRLLLPSANTSWLPWVLNPVADISSLQQPAQRNTDTLNNVEQITIDHPIAGNYLLQISADKIITADQRFAVSWMLDTADRFMWTWPCEREVIVSGRQQVLRWQSNLTGGARIEYALNDGPWNLIADHANLEDQFVKWTTPDTMATARLRMSDPSAHLVSVSAPFAISRTTDVGVVFNCLDSFMLQWNAVPGKTYQVYQLGARYLEPVDTTTGAYIVLQKKKHPGLHYAVSPLTNGVAGVRSNTLDYTDQGTACYFQHFFASLQPTNTSLLELNLGGVYGIKRIAFQKWKANDFRDLHTIENPQNSSISFSDSVLAKGINTYRVCLTLANGGVVCSENQSDLYFPKEQVIIFPNPVSQQQSFRIIAGEPGAYRVHIYDLLGKSLYAGPLNDIDQKINIRLPRGVYFIRVSDATGKSFAKKLIVY